MKQNGLFAFSIALFAVLAIGVIVLSAIDHGTLPVLMFAAIAVCALGVWLAKFIMQLLERNSERNRKSNEEYHNYILSMAKIGYLPDDFGFNPIQQIAAPSAQKPQRVFDFNPNDIHTAAVNYILFSRNLLGDSGNRLASAPECAGANIENYTARSWERIVKHLSNAYGVVTQTGPVANGGGVYVPENIGTVGALYQHVILNSAVEALPGVKR